MGSLVQAHSVSSESWVRGPGAWPQSLTWLGKHGWRLRGEMYKCLSQLLMGLLIRMVLVGAFFSWCNCNSAYFDFPKFPNLNDKLYSNTGYWKFPWATDVLKRAVWLLATSYRSYMMEHRESCCWTRMVWWRNLVLNSRLWERYRKWIPASLSWVCQSFKRPIMVILFILLGVSLGSWFPNRIRKGEQADCRYQVTGQWRSAIWLK